MRDSIPSSESRLPDFVETPVLFDTRIKRPCGKPDKHVLVMQAGRISSSSAGSLLIKL